MLSTNRNVLKALGYFAFDLLGSGPLVTGLACTGNPSLTVTIGTGRFYSYQQTDATNYGDLVPDTDLILKQGILEAAQNLSCPAPGLAGTAINYLIEAQYQDVDGTPIVLPYYNAANPQSPLAGVGNSGTAQSTQRLGIAALQVKAGAAATSGSQLTPAADTGWVGLWVVTVAQGQTTITSANIAQLPSAPFFSSSFANFLTQAAAAAFYQPMTLRTAAEIAASVVPTNITYAANPADSRRYGTVANGTTVDRPALQRMIAAAAQGMGAFSARKMNLVSDGGTFKMDGPISINPLKVSLNGNGNALDFTSVGSSFVAVTLDTQSAETDTTSQSVQLTTHPIENLVILLPNYTDNPSSVGISLLQSGSNTDQARTNFRNVSIYGGYYAVRLVNDDFCQTFDNCTFIHGPSHYQAVSVTALAGWLGEQVNFNNCFFGGALYHIQIPSGDISVVGGSMDGSTCNAQILGDGFISIEKTYFEFTDGSDSNPRFDAHDPNSLIKITNCIINPRADLVHRKVNPLIYNAGQVALENITFIGQGIQYYYANDGFLVAGTGRVSAKGVRWIDFPWFPLIHRTQQWLAYPDCNSANALSPFTMAHTGTGVSPVRTPNQSDGSQGRDAFTFSLSAGATAGATSSAAFTHAVKPGDDFTNVFTAYAPTMTNATFSQAFTFYDSNNAAIGSQATQTHFSTPQASWTGGNTTYGFSGGVPAGAETVTLTTTLTATGTIPSGGVSVYLSPWGIGPSTGIS